MNIKHIMKVTGSVALSAILATAALPVTVNAEEKDENPTEKTETVYSVLNGDGSVSDIVVSSWLHDEDGIKNLKEKLNLTDVRNVKTDETPEESNGEYTWNSDSNDVYYQGKATEKLPVSIKITYELDGQEISESDLDGKTGHLKIRIHMTNENSETKTINGKDIIIHPCFVAGGMMTLNNDHVANVKCEQGKIVSDGSSQILVFAAVPGLKETLDSADLSKVSDEMKVGDDVEIECDVTDYENAGLMMGMSDEMDISDVIGDVDSLDELTDGINQLMDADDQLIDGAKQLEEGTQTLITESEPLTSSSGSIRILSNGAVTLNDGALRLKAALGQYTGGVSQLNAGVDALYAIPQGAKKISDGITVSTSDSTSLADGVSSLTAGLEEMKSQVEKGMSGAGMTPEAMQTMAADLATANQILSSMSDMIDSELTTLNTLNDSLTATVGGLDQLKSTMGSSYNSISDSLTSALTTLNKLYYYGNLDDASKTTIKEAIDNLTAQAGNLQNAFGDVTKTVESVPSTASSMMGTLNGATEALKGMQDDIKNAQDGLGQLTEILTRSSGTLNNLGSMMNQLNQLNNGLDQLIAGSKQIQAGVTAVNAGVQQLEEQSQAGIDQVKAATSTLAGNNDALNGGMSSLQEGTQSIADQSGSFNEMADGLDSLKSAFETLHDGAKQLSDGQQQFRDEGLNELKEKVDLSVDEINMLKDIMDEVSAMNKEYREYAGDNEDYEVVTRYVFRTKTAESSK